MSKFILLSCIGLCASLNLSAQFPLMGLNDSVVYINPISKDFAVGAAAINEPSTRLLVGNGQIQVKAGNSGNLLQLNLLNGEGTRIRHLHENNTGLTDWSPLPQNTNKEHYFSFYRFGNPGSRSGIRLYQPGNHMLPSTQIGTGGVDSYFLHGNLGLGTHQPSELLHISRGRLRLDNGNDISLVLGLDNNSFPTISTGNNAPMFLRARMLELGSIARPNLLTIDGLEEQVSISNQPYSYTPPGFLLGVSGNIICNELTVQAIQDWPDYVFSADYELLPLESLVDFIKKKGHLPGVPSAKDVMETGHVELGNMQRILLEKIEELTLYIIELKAKNDELVKRVKALEQN